MSSGVDQRTSGRVPELPPGPPVPAPLQTVLYARYRHRLFPLLRRRYGDAFTLRLVVPTRRLVVLSDPEDIRTVFAGADTVMHAGEGNAIMGPALGRHSVLLSDEGAHRRIRRLLMPAFSTVALRGYADLITELARAEAGRWPHDRAFAVHPRMRALTLETILRVGFGVTSPQRLATVRPLVRTMADIGPVTLLGLPYRALRRVDPWRSYTEAQRRLEEVLFAEMADRRGSPDLADRPDVLSRLVRATESDAEGFTDEELRDQMVTLLLAGHETTATALAWTLHELAHSPRQQHLARRAADEGDDDHLTAVVKESLRLRPVVYEVARVLTRPTPVGGRLLPAGVTVMPAIGLVHADPEHYDCPHRFSPDRFTADQVPAAAWIPFGGGVRRCLGAAFALVEATAVLREVLRRHHLRPAAARREPQRARNVTLIPARGARLVASARHADQRP